MFNNFPYYNVKSVRLGSHYITSGIDPTYTLSGPLTVNEGESVTIVLTTTDVDSGEVIPYVITGITTDDINGSSLNGEFVIGSVDSIALDITGDIELEGDETLVLTLANGEDSISINISDGIISQLGQDILSLDAGENDFYGLSVAINYDGSVVATSGPFSDSVGNRSGRTRVYEIDGDIWTQLGQDIDGEAEIEYSGNKIDISDDGTIIAVSSHLSNVNELEKPGRVRIFRLVNNTWVQIGADIVGESQDDRSGISLSLNSDGKMIAISAPYNDAGSANINNNYGHVRVYRNIGDNWVQLGQDIDGENIGDLLGWSVSINGGGTIVAIGTRTDDTSFTNAGQVRIYQIVGNTWVQLGQYISGENFADNSGHSVSLNGDGTIVAIGAHLNDDGGTHSGHVKVYQLDGENWIQLGSNIVGKSAGDLSGSSVSLNDVGDIIVIGSPKNDDGGNDSGHTRVFTYDGNEWDQVGLDVRGTSDGDFSGGSIDFSSDGTTFVVGEYKNDDVATNAGRTRVFKIKQESPVVVPTYSLNSTLPTVDEGQQLTVSLTTQNVEHGTNINYTIIGISSDDIDGSPLVGSFVVGVVDSVTLNVVDDLLVEGIETLSFILDNGGDSIDIVINDTILPYYELLTSYSVNEGETILISLLTENVNNGTLVPYTITGVTSDDIDGAPLTGNFVVGTVDLIYINVTEDVLTEGEETLTITLDNGEHSVDVIINDSSQDPTYELLAPIAVNEGETILIELITTNLNVGASVPYTITGVTSDDIDGASLTGNFVVGTVDSITLNVTEDALTEGEETLTLTLDNGKDNISVILNDTSLTPIYTLSSDVTNVDEGQVLTISLLTENVNTGTVVPYTITGVTSDDIGGVSLTGNFVVSETGDFPYSFPVPLGTSGDEITFNITEDTLTEGEETLTLTLDNNQADVDVSIVDTSLDPTYELSAPASVNEGDTIVINLVTENVVAGTSIPYTITGITSDDIDGALLTGNFVVGTVDSITLNVSEDALTEGEETLTLTLDNNQADVDVSIVDTSLDPTYELSAPASVNEGDTIVINLVTENVVAGTSIPYTITGITSDDIDGALLTGNFVVGTVDSITLNVSEDFITEGVEALTFTLDNNQADVDVSIVDTSVETYELSGPTSVNEGDPIVIDLTTQGVVAGTSVPYTITGVTSDDIDGALLTGNFVVGTVDSITLNVTEDFITEGEEILTLTLDNNQANVDVSIVDTSVETYELSGPTSANEGDPIVIDLTTQGVVAGTSVPYTITGVTSDDIDGASLTGSFVVGTVDSITLNVTEDFIPEGVETLTLTLDNGEDNINVIINDNNSFEYIFPIPLSD